MSRKKRYGVEFAKDEFREQFPKLAQELEDKVMEYPVLKTESVRNVGEEELSDPDAISYLRRCRTLEEAEEIIAYLEHKGEITKEYAETLRRQAREQGVASFGERKERGYDFNKYRGRKVHTSTE